MDVDHRAVRIQQRRDSKSQIQDRGYETLRIPLVPGTVWCQMQGLKSELDSNGRVRRAPVREPLQSQSDEETHFHRG